MKNYIVLVKKNFFDLIEKVDRKLGDIFKCTKERYEYLVKYNAVMLLEILEPKEKKTKKKEVKK